MVIDNQEILPGDYQQLNLIVSRLPSGTRIYIQCHVFRAVDPGPVVLILAGIHGDEINGIEAVRRTLSKGCYNNLVSGTVIVIPLLNVFGFINFSREVPDGKDVNRSFPGTLRGSLASRVAAVLTKKILPHVNYAIDLHTGGGSRYNYPQLRFNIGDAKALQMAKSFGAPFLVPKAKISRSFRKIASEMGITVLVYEAGEAVRLDGFAIDIGVQGIQRVLKYLGVTDQAPDIFEDMIIFKSTGWLRATEAGLFTWSQSSGTLIKKGQPLGAIHSPQDDRTKRILAKSDGYIIGHNNASVVHTGDALYHVGYQGVKI